MTKWPCSSHSGAPSDYHAKHHAARVALLSVPALPTSRSASPTPTRVVLHPPHSQHALHTAGWTDTSALSPVGGRRRRPPPAATSQPPEASSVSRGQLLRLCPHHHAPALALHPLLPKLSPLTLWGSSPAAAASSHLPGAATSAATTSAAATSAAATSAASATAACPMLTGLGGWSTPGSRQTAAELTLGLGRRPTRLPSRQRLVDPWPRRVLIEQRVGLGRGGLAIVESRRHVIGIGLQDDDALEERAER